VRTKGEREQGGAATAPIVYVNETFVSPLRDGEGAGHGHDGEDDHAAGGRRNAARPLL